MSYASFTDSPNSKHPTIPTTMKGKLQKIISIIKAKTKTKDTATTVSKTLSSTSNTEWHRKESSEQIAVPITIAIAVPIAFIVIVVIFITGKAPLHSSDFHKPQRIYINI